MPSYNFASWNPLNDPTVREYTYLTTTVITSGALLYTWIHKNSLQKEHDTYKKRFRHQELLSNSYASALEALADFKDYVEIMQHNTSAQGTVRHICEHLTREFSQKPELLSAFKKTVRERKLRFEKTYKEVERALISWEHSKKKGLLTVQGPLLKSTYGITLSTLDILSSHIPYVEATFFIKDHGDRFKEEHALAQYFNDAARFKYNLDTLIRTKARVGERYPFRTYAQWVDHYHYLIRELKKELDEFQYQDFQQTTVAYIYSTFSILEKLKLHIKTSSEYEAECTQYATEIMARTQEDENRKLKEELKAARNKNNALLAEKKSADQMPSQAA
jgi:hypothetical protein